MPPSRCRRAISPSASRRKKAEGDLGDLSETFNNMTEQLRSQRAELLSANAQIDSRRRFTEAVLSGVTAGVIGIDGDGRVTIANRTAMRLLGLGETVDRAPADRRGPARNSAPVVAAALRDDRPEHRDQISVNRGGRERTINVRVTTERLDGRRPRLRHHPRRHHRPRRRRSGARPGPTSPAASPTRSRTR